MAVLQFASILTDKSFINWTLMRHRLSQIIYSCCRSPFLFYLGINLERKQNIAQYLPYKPENCNKSAGEVYEDHQNYEYTLNHLYHFLLRKRVIEEKCKNKENSDES
jgi:hypothetical protein